MVEERTGLKGWEKIGFAFLMIILVVSTLSTAVASQQAAKAAKNTDIIAQCTTPGTSCFKLTQLQEVRRTAQNKCVIDSILNLPPIPERAAKRQEILDGYDKCVDAEVILASTTTTTTTKKNG